MKRKQTGVFSGSFNPIHIGHLILANYIVEFSNLDEICFVVSPHNPLKNAGELLSDHIRLEMTRLAVCNYDKFRVSDIEFGMPKPSYTIDTLNKLSDENPNIDFTLIIGADSWNDIHKWKSYEELLGKYKLLVYPRQGYEISIEESFRDNVQEIKAPVIGVSSTLVRNMITAGKETRALLPESVYNYIKRHQIYL